MACIAARRTELRPVPVYDLCYCEFGYTLNFGGLHMQYERIAENNRNARRTIADALEVLRTVTDFKADFRAKVRIGHITLPSGKAVGLVDIEFEGPCSEKSYLVSLATSAKFRALCQDSSQREHFEISLLDGAIVDRVGSVTLEDGTVLKAVEVLPANLPYEPSEIDWRIVWHTIVIVGAEERCFRSWPEGLPPSQTTDPSTLRIDCSKVYDLTIPPLKVLHHDLGLKDPELGALSQQQISDSLAKFGMRPIRARPRKK